jgi:hypothetical protein
MHDSQGGALPRRVRRLVATLVLALAGCTAAQPLTPPDGRQGYTVECSGSVLSWEDCFARADDLWRGRNYDVFTRVGEEGALMAAEPQPLHDRPTTSRRMVIVCKGA